MLYEVISLPPLLIGDSQFNRAAPDVEYICRFLGSLGASNGRVVIDMPLVYSLTPSMFLAAISISYPDPANKLSISTEYVPLVEVS